ncbi:hypothetical protein [Streptomyces acidicola]|uniref:hypothetical protein n=1 Tax=Streptomyces acidicola TaxID=2596892 RepID=UPI003429585D
MRRRACVLSAATLVGTVLGAAAPVAAGEPTAEVGPRTVAPGETVTVSVTCDPTGGAPDTIDAGSQAFEQGTVKLQRVSGGADPGSGREPGAGRETGAGREPGAGRDPASGNDPGTGRDPALGNDPAAEQDPTAGSDPTTGSDPAPGHRPPAADAPGTVPDSGAGLDPAGPGSGRVQGPGSSLGPTTAPSSAAVPSPAAVPRYASVSDPEAVVAPAAVRSPSAGFGRAAARVPAPGLIPAAAPATVPAPATAPATAPAPAAGPNASAGLVYRGTARIATAGNFAGGAGGAGKSSEWSVDGKCPAALGGQGKQWSASFTAALGSDQHGKEPQGDNSQAPSFDPDGMRHGVHAGEGGALTDSVPAMIAGGLLIAGAIGAAVQRILLRRGTSKHR